MCAWTREHKQETVAAPKTRNKSVSSSILDGIIDSMDTEKIPGFSEGQGGLACCSPWGRKDSDMTE